MGEYCWKDADIHCHHHYVLPAVRALLPEARGLSVLDLGCGNGYVANWLSTLCHDVTGLDLSESGIAAARSAYPHIAFHVCSVYDDLSCFNHGGGWDVILALDVIEHLYTPKGFLENIHSNLKPYGAVVLSTPYHGYLKNLALSLVGGWDRHLTVDWEGGHIKFFSVDSLSTMLRGCGFTDVVFRFAGRVPYLWKSMVCRARADQGRKPERPAAAGDTESQ